MPKPAKTPKDYEKRDDVKEFEQKPISDMNPPATMNPKLLAATISTAKTNFTTFTQKGHYKRTNGFKSCKKKSQKKN